MDANLSKQVEMLEFERRELESLCQEIVATLDMPGNAAQFAELGAPWHDLVKSWKKRFLEIRRPVIALPHSSHAILAAKQLLEEWNEAMTASCGPLSFEILVTPEKDSPDED